MENAVRRRDTSQTHELFDEDRRQQGRSGIMTYGGGGMRPGAFLTAVVVLIPTACMPQDRINRSCQWNDPVVIGPPGSRERRAHLEEDVRVAHDLGIRYGDSVAGRIWNDANRHARESCTNASLQQIMRQHDVSRREIVAVTGARDVWLDLLLVFAPMLLVFIAGSRIFVRHIAGDYERADWLMVVVIVGLLTPIVAFMGVGVAQIWSVVVEEYRLRSDHISYRAAYLPLYVHKEAAWAIAAALFVAVAARVRRHALSGRDARVIPPG
jgi:hypothetical protein